VKDPLTLTMSNDSLAVAESVTRSSDQLRPLIEVSEAIANHRDLRSLVRDLAKRLPALVPFELIALFLHDPVKNVMTVHTLAGIDGDRMPPGLEVPTDASFSGLAFTTQTPVVIRSQAEALRFPTSGALVQQLGVESFCMIPLTTIVRPLGAMAFGTARPNAISEPDLEFLGLLVKQVAVAVDNVLHDESATAVQAELSQERDRLRLLLEVSESIASQRNLDDLFRDLAERLPRVVPFDYINVLLHDPARDVMRLHILIAPEDSTIRPGLELPVDESASGLVWKTQQPLVVDDLEVETRFPRLIAMMRDNGVQSFCAIPLTTALRRLGSFGFGSLTRRQYREDDLNFMQQIANQVAVAIDNVLHDEGVRAAQQALTRERDRLQLLLEVNNAVVSRLELDQVFTSVTSCLQRVIPHEHSSLLLYEPETRRFRKHVPQIAGAEAVVADCEGDTQAGRSPASIAISTRRTSLFGERDLQELAARSQLTECVLAAGFKSVCSIPLMSRDWVLGALNVASKRPDAFAAEDVELLTLVGQQIAIAVENGLAFREIAELKEKLNTEKLYLEDEIRTDRNFEQIIGQSPALKQVLEQVEIVAPTDSTVLIQGETGTGKELVARAIHNLSERRGRTFVKLNCAAIPTGLLESELFGHEKGAFTGAIAQRIGRFELAHGGTLFLDEVGDIPLELQSKLLRVLQEQEFERLGSTRTIRVDIRLIAATNRDLAAMVDQKQFRSDLYYRLNVFPIANPSLRERREDIGALVRYFAQKFSRRMHKHITSIPSEAMAALASYHWPGNIRELENLIERAVILSRGSTLDVPLAELKQPSRTTASLGTPSATTLEDAEREHIRVALQESNWQVGGASGAAARLGMKRTTLQSKMAKLGIERPRGPLAVVRPHPHLDV
jgi:formate hydrogenlyase transcriptional activator